MKKALAKGFIAIVLVAAMVLPLTGCGAKMVEKTLIVRNLTDYTIESVDLATEEGRRKVETRIYLVSLDDQPMAPYTDRKVTVQIPEKDLSEEWYFTAYGDVDGVGRSTEDIMGTIWEDETEGFNIFYDEDYGCFEYTPLYNVH